MLKWTWVAQTVSMVGMLRSHASKCKVFLTDLTLFPLHLDCIVTTLGSYSRTVLVENPRNGHHSDAHEAKQTCRPSNAKCFVHLKCEQRKYCTHCVST